MNVQIQIAANYDGYPVNLQNDHFTKSFIHKPSNSYFRPNFSNKYIDVNRINYILTFLLLHWEFGGLINNNEIRATSSNDSQICDINLRPRKWVAIGVNLYSRGRQRDGSCEVTFNRELPSATSVLVVPSHGSASEEFNDR